MLTVMVVTAGAWAGVFAYTYQQLERSNTGKLDFAEPMAVPPLAPFIVDGQGRKRFDLTMQAGESELLPGQRTSTWGVNGSHLGPTIRVNRGDTVQMNVRNTLSLQTTLHWHGAHLPAEMDGGPHQMVQAGAVWQPTWTVKQPAATLWYHPHLHGDTATHVYRGLAGMFVVDDPAASTLPAQYGVDDVPLILQDRNFRSDGELDFRHATIPQQLAGAGNVGILGDTILVNGTYNPHFATQSSLVRFRILNASNARVYNLGFADDRPLTVVATENGLLPRPVDVSRLPVSPGERYEVVIRFTAGEQPVLRSFAPDLQASFPISRFAGGDDSFDLLQIRAGAQLRPSGTLPAQLPAPQPPPASTVQAARQRTFTLSGASINGRLMSMSRVDTVVAAGSTEVWRVEGIDETPHNFHMHGASFWVQDIDGQQPPEYLAGAKDTVYLPPGKTVTIAVRFDTHTSTTHPFMYHCHLLRHEDQGMMAQYIVVPPGQEDQPPGRIDGHPEHP